jgi:uncharacterized repeat protein (TIGR03803 family)
MRRRELVLTTALLLCAPVVLSVPAHAQTYSVIHNFTGDDGRNPEAGLTLNGTSSLFGGAANVVFILRQTGTGWTLLPIYEFNSMDGSGVQGRLTIGPDGALYGASGFGGSGYGFIFMMRPPTAQCMAPPCYWTETLLYEFEDSDGYEPTGGLIFDSAGNIYGTTQAGGLFHSGLVFMLSPSQGGWTETILHNFHYFLDGDHPNGNLVMDRSGNIIGTASYGGVGLGYTLPGGGVVFELTPTSSGWVESTLHVFTGKRDGDTPGAGLIPDAAGNLYGVTQNGGANGGGTVYELTPTNGSYAFQVLYNFTGTIDQVGPYGLLAIDSSGSLYGVTITEGAFGEGNIFKLTPNGGQWVYTDLHDFSGGADGGTPLGGVTLDPSGNLYGTTNLGGSDDCGGGCGVIWEVTPQ